MAVLDPVLAQRVQSFLPISEGNQPHQLPVNPLASQIVPVLICNPDTLIPYVKSGIVTSGPGITDWDIQIIPPGYHLILTRMEFFIGAGGANGEDVAVYDDTTKVWYVAQLVGTLETSGQAIIAPVAIEIRTKLVLQVNKANDTWYNFNGYYERISNV